MLNWDHFRYMIAVADQGSLSKAAIALNVSHATVLRAVNRLEKALETRLFDHVKTGYRLTQDGEDILDSARLIQGNVQQIIRTAKSLDSVPSGPLNILIPDSSLFDLMPVFKDFNDIYSDIVINTRRGEISKPSEFIEQQVDVLIMVTNAPPDALVGRQLTHIQFAAYSPPIQPDDNNVRNWVTWSQTDSSGDDMHVYQQQVLLRDGKLYKVAMHASSHGDALKAVRAGIGSAFLKRSADTADLTEFTLNKPLRDWGIWALTHPDFRSAARVTALMRFLAEKLS